MAAFLSMSNMKNRLLQDQKRVKRGNSHKNYFLDLKRLKFLGTLLVVLVAIGGAFIFSLQSVIVSKFKSHRWNLPSRVYSESLYLYPGLKISRQKLESRLKNLAYNSVDRPIKAAGEYQAIEGGLSVFLHDFQYPLEPFYGFPLNIYWEGEGIDSLERLDVKGPLTNVKLEPELIASIFDEEMEDRTLVKLDDVPRHLIDAVIAVEDERFYVHHGVDPMAIVRAFFVDVLSGRLKQGGSTLTQQLVKNFFLTSKKSFVRKFNEIVMAVLLEQRYTKEDILEAYLNEIYLGQRGAASIAGVGEAVRLYFSKDVGQLNLSESALLAGLIQSPGKYSPKKFPDRALERRNLVLKRMLEQGVIEQTDYERALEEKISISFVPSKAVQAPYFIDFVQKQLKENFPAKKLQSEGLKIFTTLDMEAQRTAERAVQKGLGALDEKNDYLKKLKKEEDKKLQACLIAVQPNTGYIRAYVGGRDYLESQFDHITDAWRQPGSSFKPFVFLTALNPERKGKKYTLASPMDDTPFEVTSGGEPWRPSNYDKKNHGKILLREALEKSYNVSTARMAIDIGLENVVHTARLAGMDSPMEAFPSLSLGSFEVRPLELVAAYTIFPNRGIRAEPIAIRHVITPTGEVLEQRSFQMKQVFSPDVIYLVNSALKGVMDRGTGASVRHSGIEGLLAGKTGTTSDYRDAWFVGYSPELLALTWVGFDDTTPTQLTGAQAALPMWVDFMKNGGKVVREQDFLATQQIVLVEIDAETGLLYEASCEKPQLEAFIRGTEPREGCAQK